MLTHNSSSTSLKKNLARDLSQSSLNKNQYQLLNSLGGGSNSLNNSNFENLQS